MKKLTAVLLIATLLLSICPQVFAATFNWVTQNPIVCNNIYEYCEFGVIVNDVNRNMGLIGVDGTMRIPYSKGYKELQFADTYAGYISFVDSSDKGGIVDANGNVIVKAGLYDRVFQRVDDYVYIVGRKTGQNYYGYCEYEYGLGDVNGNMIIPYGQYKEIQPGGWYGTVQVRNENYNLGVYTSAGQPVIPIEYGYEEVYATSSEYRYTAYINETWYLLDNTAQALATLDGYLLNAYDFPEYLVTEVSTGKKIYDINGNFIAEIESGKEVINGKYIHDKNNGMLSDIYGNIIIAPGTFAAFRVLDENHYSACTMEGQCAIFDMSGNIVMPYGCFESMYDIYEIIDGKYIMMDNKIMDIYGNVLVQSEDYIYYMGNDYFSTQKYDYDAVSDSYCAYVKIGKVDGELAKPAVPVQPAAPVASSIGVVVNGMPVQFTDQAPVIVDGRTLLPLRAVFDLLGATIEWEAETQTVYAKRGNVDITLTIGSDQLWVNGQPKTLDVRAQIMNGRTMVPVRAVADAFGCGIDWNAATSTVIITTN